MTDAADGGRDRPLTFVIAVQGTRGDIEPCTALAVELLRRGHRVRMAVPPNLIRFVETAGVRDVVAYGPDSAGRALSWDPKSLARWTARRAGRPDAAAAELAWWRVNNPVRVLSQLRGYLTDGWAEMSRQLEALVGDADLILTGMTYQEVAANVAEHHRIPFAALHFCPVRPSTQTLPVPIPKPVAGPLLATSEWFYWRIFKPADDAQRATLGLPRSTTRAQHRIESHGALEIQAYDRLFYPGLEAEWGYRRPFVGSITLQRPAADDPAVLAWLDAGTPPIYFGLGSMPIEDPAEALTMVTDVCGLLGERALVCSGDLDPAAGNDRVLIVPAVNHSKVFPRCRAIVHHGGSGTTAAAARAGVPAVILWVGADQPAWANKIEALGIGAGGRFGATDAASLLGLLRRVLHPDCASRAAEVAAQLTDPSVSVATAASLLEDAARHADLGGRPTN